MVSYGELGLASDDELLQDMVDAVQEPQRQIEQEQQPTMAEHQMLTAESFARALTRDVGVYDVRNEVKPITNFDAARGNPEKWKAYTTTPISRQSIVVPASKEEQACGLMRDGIYQAHTLSSIDITAATYKNKHLIIALWTTILVTYFA